MKQRRVKQPCGLLLLNSNEPVLMKEANAEVSVIDMVAEVRVNQVYLNNAETSMEGVFVLWLDASSVVQEFMLWNHNMTIKGRMVEMEHEEFGLNSTGLLSGMASKIHAGGACSMFSINLGQIPLGKISVCFSFTTVLDLEDGLPVVRIPHSISKEIDVSKHQADRPRISYAHSKKLKVSMKVVGRSTVHSLSYNGSNLEAFDAQTQGKIATVELGLQKLHLTQDVTMKIGMTKPLPFINVVLEEHENSWAAMVSIFPDSSEQDLEAEYIIILERSKGLTGAQFHHIRSTVCNLVQALPPECYFNVIDYGAQCDSLFPKPEKYHGDLIPVVLSYLDCMVLDERKGSNLLYALQHAVGQRHMDYNQKVFVVTGGEAAPHSGILDIVQDNCLTMRIFTLGILVKDVAARNFLSEVASAGYGTAEVIFEHELDVVEEVALKQLTIAKQQGLYGLRVLWHWHGCNNTTESSSPSKNNLGIFAPHKGRESSLREIPETECISDTGSEIEIENMGLWSSGFVCAPHRPKPSFPGYPSTMFTLFKAENKPPASVSILVGGKDEQRWRVRIGAQDHISGTKIHTMAARAVVEDLEEGVSALHDSRTDQRTIDVELVDISCRYMVPTSRTVFVGIRSSDNGAQGDTSGGSLIPPSRWSRSLSRSSSRKRSSGDEGDAWRIGRKSVTKSFRVASIKLRFSMAYAKFKGDADPTLPKRKSGKLVQWGSGRHQHTTAGPHQGAAGTKAFITPSNLKSSLEKASVRAKIKFFEKQSNSIKVASDPNKVLRQLLKLQDKSGCFLLTEKLAYRTLVPYKKLRQQLPKVMKEASGSLPAGSTAAIKSTCKSIWGSSIAVAFMYQKLIELQDSWKEAAGIAELWMREVLSGDKKMADSMISMAQELLIALWSDDKQRLS